MLLKMDKIIFTTIGKGTIKKKRKKKSYNIQSEATLHRQYLASS